MKNFNILVENYSKSLKYSINPPNASIGKMSNNQ